MPVEIRSYVQLLSTYYLNPELNSFYEVVWNNILLRVQKPDFWSIILNFLCHSWMNETPSALPYLGGNVYFPVKSLSLFFFPPWLLHYGTVVDTTRWLKSKSVRLTLSVAGISFITWTWLTHFIVEENVRWWQCTAKIQRNCLAWSLQLKTLRQNSPQFW